MREREEGRKKGGRDSRWRNSWLVGFLEEASFGIYSVGKLVGGRWALCVLSRLLGRLLLRRFRLPISPVFENFFRGCLRFPAPLSRINESAREREREKNWFFSFSPFQWSISNRFVEARLDARKD